MKSDLIRFIKFIRLNENGCWEWTGVYDNHGYGQFSIHGNVIRAYRYSYEYFNETTIPTNLVIDHLCRNRGCANPDHLEAVTHKENVLRGFSISAINSRKVHCKRGHILPSNRLCDVCRKMTTSRWKDTHREYCRQYAVLYRKKNKGM